MHANSDRLDTLANATFKLFDELLERFHSAIVGGKQRASNPAVAG